MILGKILDRSFYLNNTLSVAKSLIGKTLVVYKDSTVASECIDNNVVRVNENAVFAKIVETEAYLGHEDKACHSYNKKIGGRTNIMFNEGGYAYVYLIYGMYYCLNFVTGKQGVPHGVLIRALEPISKTKTQQDYECLSSNIPQEENRAKIREINKLKKLEQRVFAGPGKLCLALGITKNDYGTDLCGTGRIFVVDPIATAAPEIVETTRIGLGDVGEAKDYLYRFYDKNSLSVSKK